MNGTQVIDELLVTGHPAVIHFPIMGVMLGTLAAISALILAIVLENTKDKMSDKWHDRLIPFIDRFEFSSWILIMIGEISMIVAAWTGVRASNDIDTAINNELLEFKIKLSIFAFFLLLAPLAMKVYFGFKLERNIFGQSLLNSEDVKISKIIPILYILPLIIATFMIVLISGAGGRYVYGHSILDTLGLGNLLPGSPR